MKQNFSTIILVFLLGVVIGFAFYMSSPKSWFSKQTNKISSQEITQQKKDDPSNKNLLMTQQTSQTVNEWQDYHDDAFGFTIKFPKNITVSPLSDDSLYYEGQPDDQGICATQSASTSCLLSIKVFYNPKEMPLVQYYKVPETTHEISLEEYSRLLKETVFFNPNHYQLLNTFQSGGRLAYKFKDLQAQQPTTVTLIPNKKLVYEISDSFLNEQDHETMIKSLKFDEDQQPIISEYFSYLLVNTVNTETSCEDNKLYRYDELGDKKLVFASVLQQIKDKSFIEAKKQHCNLALLKEKYFPEKNKLIFRAGFMETDAATFGLFSFDTKTQKFSFMKINQHYPAFGVDATSPDGTKYLAVERQGNYNGKRLYLLDLINDSSKVLVELKKGETLLGIGDFGQMRGKIEFIDPHTISYEVYKGDNSVEGYDGQEHSLLETRKLKF